ncbi:hypothetical protein [Thalassovita sp.]|uniref:hypothetical protein n=1 Tax=Thalassovita sp. TaxID=1979401 RepID=UPI0029DE63CE|nr:hypothetical protein [Thalassovita sp.]
MQHSGLEQFLKDGGAALAKGPVALIFCEDEVEIDSTLRHHLDCGFKAVLALIPDAFTLADDTAARVIRVSCDTLAADVVSRTVNRIAATAPDGTWLYYGYNAEYLFYPFCEHRTIGEMLAFHAEERRDAMLTYVIDLYAGDLQQNPTAVSLEQTFLDKTGYFALSRADSTTGHPKDRQLDFFGGLRWRFEEHIPPARRKIDRIALFRTRPGLTLGPDLTFNNQEYNTYACPWHHNLTAAVCSFRTAKALKRNPGSAFDIETFRWHNSVPFEWHSGQLLDLGLMEPGQWF